jgi:ABC-2 type transport system ATP-binding protein
MITTENAAAPVLPTELDPGPIVVRTGGLEKRYGRVEALRAVDLQVPDGAVYVLVGPNGAGKSTLLRTLLNLAHRDAGTVNVLGLDPASRGGDVRSLVGYVPETQALGYSWMTVARLMDHYAIYHDSWDGAYAQRLAQRYEVEPSRKCRTLSKGQARRVQLLLALAHRPPVLLLDEPTDGLDHVSRDATLGILSEHLADVPTTVIICTHRVYEVEGLVDHVGVLSGGKLLAQLTREELRGRLRRYWADVPEGWSAPEAQGYRVIRQAGSPREIEWTVWGDEERVRRSLTGAGASIRHAAPLSVDDAAVALLSKEVA